MLGLSSSVIPYTVTFSVYTDEGWLSCPGSRDDEIYGLVVVAVVGGRTIFTRKSPGESGGLNLKDGHL